MAMVNSLANVKDSRWLQLEVCREYQRNKCTRSDTECKFAHPPASVEVQNGRVIACYDSIKGRCNREKPPCKYFHPPPHLKDQLLINGRNHLALKNAFLQQVPLQPVLAGQIPASAVATNSPYLTSLPTMGSAATFPYLTHSPMMAAAAAGLMPAEHMAAQLSVVPASSLVSQQKVPRTDRLECQNQVGTPFLCSQLPSYMTFPGISPYSKRPALDKSGVPVYQPGTAAYQQALAMQVQQPFVPVSFTGHPTSLPRF